MWKRYLANLKHQQIAPNEMAHNTKSRSHIFHHLKHRPCHKVCFHTSTWYWKGNSSLGSYFSIQHLKIKLSSSQLYKCNYFIFFSLLQFSQSIFKMRLRHTKADQMFKKKIQTPKIGKFEGRKEEKEKEPQVGVDEGRTKGERENNAFWPTILTSSKLDLCWVFSHYLPPGGRLADILSMSEESLFYSLFLWPWVPPLQTPAPVL